MKKPKDIFALLKYIDKQLKSCQKDGVVDPIWIDNVSKEIEFYTRKCKGCVKGNAGWCGKYCLRNVIDQKKEDNYV